MAAGWLGQPRLRHHGQGVVKWGSPGVGSLEAGWLAGAGLAGWLPLERGILEEFWDPLENSLFEEF